MKNFLIVAVALLALGLLAVDAQAGGFGFGVSGYGGGFGGFAAPPVCAPPAAFGAPVYGGFGFRAAPAPVFRGGFYGGGFGRPVFRGGFGRPGFRGGVWW